MQQSSDKYAADRTSLPCEALEWIRQQTHLRTNYPQMLSGRVQGELLKLLVEISGARRALEIGTFTGYSAVCIALGLPEDGHLDALEVNDELEDLIREGWLRASVSSRITLHICDAKEFLRRCTGVQYDFVFVDANKREYADYYNLVLPLVRPGGIIVADDVLWDGKVCRTPMPTDPQTVSIASFNDMVAADPRVEQVMLPVRDGLTVMRKLY